MNAEQELLTPELTSQLDRLDVLARLLVEGFLTGLHRSPYHGFSAEFAEYRRYQPGEPATNIDWRVYARSDRVYQRVFAEETNLRGTLLLDCSASMRFTGDERRPTKLAYGRVLAACLAYLLLRQNDAVGLVAFDERPLLRVPARSVRRQLFQVLKGLREAPAGQGTDLGPVLHDVAERIPRRGLVMLVSDLMDEPDQVLSGLKHFRHRGHEVLVLQILDPREVDLDFPGEVEFSSLEDPSLTLRTEPAHVREGYRDRLDGWRARMRRECRRHLIDLVELTTDQPVGAALGAYLMKRGRLH
ncbi:DUF58 domain-containing protein [bacterium]|nr:DUF58 domain-containing protein [bacterium]